MLERLGGGRLRPVVMDFGLARDSGASTSQGLTESGAVIGTPAYMSPEQARGEARRLDRRSDVYSLGATLYDLLSGKPPFQDETVVNLLLKVVSEPPVPLRSQLPDVPEALELIVSKCLNKEAEQRYPSALALAQDLDRYLNAERVVARRLGYGYRLRYFAKRNRSLTAVIAALIVAAIALLFVGIRGRIVALRKEREAREQAALAQTLGQSVKDLEWLVRTAYLLPLHDTAYEKGIVRGRMATITADLARAGASGARLGAYVLGRGHLALHEWDRAHEQLARAEGLGYRDAGLDYALGRVLGEKYSRALDEARKSGDKSFVEKRKKELETEFLIPARTYLQKSRGHDTESPSYVEALLDFYNEHYDAALINAHMARKQAPWLYEALKLEGDVHMVRALAQRDHGDNDTAERSFASAVARYEEAATIGHSDPQVHEALAEAWIRQEEMDLYRGVDPTPKMEKALAAAERAVEAEPEAAGGYIKQAFAYVFAAHFDMRLGHMSRARIRCQKQALSASSALRYDPANALAHDLHGNSYRCIAETISVATPEKDSFLQIGEISLRKSIEYQPRFPWALNDLAGILAIKANTKVTKGVDPTDLTSTMRTLSKLAIRIDPNYVSSYQVILGALEIDSRWQLEQGIDPSDSFRQAELISNEALKIQPKYWPTYWNLALIGHHLLQYQADSRTVSPATITSVYFYVSQVVELAAGMPDSHALSALLYSIVHESIRNSAVPGISHRSALNSVSACYAISPGNPECLAAEVSLLGALADSDLKHKLSVMVENKSLSAEHSQVCATAAASSLIHKPQIDKDFISMVQQGLSCARVLITASPNLPRAHALRGILLLMHSSSLKDPLARLPIVQQAAADFDAAFTGNRILLVRYGALATRARQELRRGQ
jgi:tetratricopeptide (TPR) repeat protein